MRFSVSHISLRRFVRGIFTRFSIVACLTGHALGEEWTTFRGNAQRSGIVDRSPLPTKPVVRWTYRGKDHVSPSVDSSPALSGGLVYVGLAEHSVFSPRGRILCLDAASGDLRWEKKTGFPVFSSPSVSGGRVFVGEGYHEDSECHLYCLDAGTGKELWNFQAASHIESGAHVQKGRVYFGAGDDGIYCLDAERGKVIWHFPGEHVDMSPLVSSGRVFAGTGYGKHVAICLSAKDGKPMWRTPLDLPAWGSPVRLGGRLYMGLGNGNLLASASEPKGRVVCLAAASGKKIWSRDFSDAVLTAVAHGKGKLFVGSRDGNLYALSPAKGEVLWKLSLGAPVVSSPLVGEKRVAAVSTTGTFVVASAESGEELSRLELSRTIGEGAAVRSSPGAAGGRVVVGSSSGVVVSLGEKE